ncbi:Competence protein [compost metagenome]
MIFLLFLALSLSNPLPPSLLKNTTDLAEFFHQKCTHAIPQTLQNDGALSSLLCGEKITDLNLQKNLTQTSLVHLFVISGSHLILLDELFSKIAMPFFLRFTLLLFYSLTASWEAPVVRALMGLGVRKFHNARGLHFTSDLSVLATGLLTLFLFPSWGDSLSLQLSWAASLALCGPSVFKIRTVYYRILLIQLLVFLFLLPLLWGFGSLHPLGLLFNIFLAPVIAFVLLPLGLVVVILPNLGPLFDGVLNFFSMVLFLYSDPIVLPSGTALARTSLWVWIGFLHLTFYFGRLYLRQGKDSSR